MRAVAPARPPATIAFDRLAPQYDALAAGEIFQLLRERTHQAFARQFTAGSRVLEIGCGTGIDTVYLASRGIDVVACDPSEEMVARSLRRLAREGLESRALVLPCGLHGLATDLAALPDSHGRRDFDGIVSNFGALNCVEQLAPLGALARTSLRPGGVVLVNLMGRHCAFETLYFLATRRRQLATRRAGSGAVAVPVAGIEMPTFYHRIADVRVALGPEMRLAAIQGIGVAVPPPYFEPRWRKMPRLVRSLARRVDGLLAPLPPFNRIGDHVLLQFEKGKTHA